MSCPKCGSEVVTGRVLGGLYFVLEEAEKYNIEYGEVAAAALANRCSHCRWIEVNTASFLCEDSVRRQQDVDEDYRGRLEFAKDHNWCLLCGKSRGEVNRLITGARGSICSDCIAIAQEMDFQAA